MFSYRQTQVVRGMLDRGDKIHDIAAYFGENPARVMEVKNGTSAYATAAEPLARDKLPPPGPYLTQYALHSVIKTLNEAIEAIEMAESEDKLEDVKAALLLAKETIQAKINSLEEV